MTNRFFAVLLVCSGWLALTGATGEFPTGGQEEGGIGGTGMVQGQVPEEVFEPPELVDSIEDAVPEIPTEVGGGDIPESPEIPDSGTPTGD